MKKLAMLVVIVALVALVGCSNNSSSGTSAGGAVAGSSSPWPIESEYSLEETSQEMAVVEEPEPEPEPELEPEYDPNDPYAPLRCDEELVNFVGQSILQTPGFTAAAYIKRGDKFYSITGYVSEETARYYNIGQPCQICGRDMAYLYGLTDSRTHVQCSIGNVPALKLNPGDEVRLYSKSNSDVYLLPAKFLGFTFGHYEQMGHIYIVNNMDDYFEVPSLTNCELRTDNGTVQDVSDDLTPMAEYTLSWNEGSTLHERKVVANSRQYSSIPFSYTSGIKVPGSPTTEGYSILDLSAAPSGLYKMGGGGGGYIEIP